MFGRRRALVGPRSVAPVPAGTPGILTGWAPYGSGQNPNEQIGAFAGSLLNQYPANVPGVQLQNGRVGNNSSWFYPTRFALPIGSTQQTMRPATAQGGSQRYGSTFTGPLGPINVAAAQARLAAAQVRQSGLAAMQWAAPLIPTQ